MGLGFNTQYIQAQQAPAQKQAKTRGFKSIATGFDINKYIKPDQNDNKQAQTISPYQSTLNISNSSLSTPTKQQRKPQPSSTFKTL